MCRQCVCLDGAGGDPLPRPLAGDQLQLRHSVRGPTSRTVDSGTLQMLSVLVDYCSESRRFTHSF